MQEKDKKSLWITIFSGKTKDFKDTLEALTEPIEDIEWSEDKSSILHKVCDQNKYHMLKFSVKIFRM